ncbi:MAG: hypothetical protein PVG39_02770 [Desulfobacteraceae bacterium]|jgi:hypothetical protein
MELGIIRGYEIRTNKDGPQNKLLLQVEMIPGDVRTVEFMPQAGEDTNPAIGSRVYVISAAAGYQIAISSTDDLTPEVDSGEKELYSTNGSSKLARLKLNLDSEIELNGNADYAVSWTDLESILQQLVTDINTIFVTAADGAVYGGGLTIDLSAAKVDKVRLP